MQKYNSTIEDSSIPLTGETITASKNLGFYESISWGAIIGGAVVAMGIHILLSALGAGVGLSTFEPITDANAVGQLSVVAAILWTIGALLALWSGGFVAGGLTHSPRSGALHGVVVWSLALIVTVLLLTMGTGMVLGGALKVVRAGLGAGGSALSGGIEETAKAGIERSGEQIGSFIDEAVQSGSGDEITEASTRAKREIGFAVTKLFAPGNDVTSQENRAAVTTALVEHTGMNEAEATQRVNDWTASYNELKTELSNLATAAEEKARQAADLAAERLSQASIWSFFALLLGLIVATLGGFVGANSSLKHLRSSRVGVR